MKISMNTQLIIIEITFNIWNAFALRSKIYSYVNINCTIRKLKILKYSHKWSRTASLCTYSLVNGEKVSQFIYAIYPEMQYD